MVTAALGSRVFNGFSGLGLLLVSTIISPHSRAEAALREVRGLGIRVFATLILTGDPDTSKSSKWVSSDGWPTLYLWLLRNPAVSLSPWIQLS
jgi:hypothetical protein